MKRCKYTVVKKIHLEEISNQMLRSETKAIVTLSSIWPSVSNAVLKLPQQVPTIIVKHEVSIKKLY